MMGPFLHVGMSPLLSFLVLLQVGWSKTPYGVSLTMALLLTVPARLILTRKSPAVTICCGNFTTTCANPSLGTLRTDSTSSAETVCCGSSIWAVKVERFSPGYDSILDARRTM